MAANFAESNDDDTEYLEVEDLQNDPVTCWVNAICSELQ
jgi:hypothetical protein